MNAIQKRLAMFLAELHISMQKFERQCDMGQGAASKLTLKSYATTFAKISQTYPQLNIDWLKTGEGQMLKPTNDGSDHIRKVHSGNSSEDIMTDGEQLAHYKAIIAAKDEQISRLLTMIEEKDKTLSNLLEKLCNQITN